MIGAGLAVLAVVLIVAIGAYVTGKKSAKREAKEHELDLSLKRSLEAEAEQLKAEAAKQTQQKIDRVDNMTASELEREANK